MYVMYKKHKYLLSPLASAEIESTIFEGLQPGKYSEYSNVQFVVTFYFRGQHSVNNMVNPSEDIDVEMERQRLFGGRTGNDVLLLYNLRKCYGGFNKKNAAVENISLGITKGEVKRTFFSFRITLDSEQLFGPAYLQSNYGCSSRTTLIVAISVN